eukprot:TRINITY_DN77422_c0_g1_i1.p1 TRINITY_DN77422_c0_g1~~TRINITY_DN77422_c0_g1_i1.p1  ORF type:complete len:290 (-),score=34.62 TRINITY_DN77422_c0_g1_i1:205-1041(-)
MAGNILPTVLAAIAFFVVALAGGAAVTWMSKVSSRWVQLCNALAGGVLIGVALCHMLGDNISGLTDWGQKINKAFGGDPDDSMPLGLATAGYGFFFVISIEYFLDGGETEETRVSLSSEERQCSSSRSEQPRVNHGLTGITTFLGVSIHSIIEGTATGATQSASTFGVLVFAILLHKGFAAFAVAASLPTQNGALWWSLVIAFALTGPVGLAVGAVCKADVNGQGSALLQCIAAGTLLAVGINEMLIPALNDKSDWKKRRLFAALAGFSAMALLSIWA